MIEKADNTSAEIFFKQLEEGERCTGNVYFMLSFLPDYIICSHKMCTHEVEFYYETTKHLNTRITCLN